MERSCRATATRKGRSTAAMDGAFVIPGTNIRMGLDGLIGFVPVASEAVSGLISSYLIWEARQLGAPAWLIGRMIAS
jgi:Domain of unknown function (DUF4112)